MMNEKEYKTQVALGTIDYRGAAVETTSKEVLARIIEDTQCPDARAAVAINPKTDVRTLTRIIIDRDTENFVLDLCVWHPAVTEKVLEIWQEKIYMASHPAFKIRLHAMQAARGVRVEGRISLNIPSIFIDDTTTTTGKGTSWQGHGPNPYIKNVGINTKPPPKGIIGDSPDITDSMTWVYTSAGDNTGVLGNVEGVSDTMIYYSLEEASCMTKEIEQILTKGSSYESVTETE